MKRVPAPHFGQALRALRKAKGLSQEDFDQVSGRTYISQLERGEKQPTVEKVCQLAAVLEMHPAALFAAAFVRSFSADDVRALLSAVEAQLVASGASRASLAVLRHR